METSPDTARELALLETIERDPNGSLHKKVQAFVDFVNSPGLGLQLAVNDPDAGIAFVLLP